MFFILFSFVLFIQSMILKCDSLLNTTAYVLSSALKPAENGIDIVVVKKCWLNWHFRTRQPTNCRHQLVPRGNWFPFDTPPNRRGTVFAQNFDFYPYINDRNSSIFSTFIQFTWAYLFSNCVNGRCTYILTSQDFSWLQNGQLNCVSSGWIALRFGGGLFFAFLRPMFGFRRV